MNLNNLGQVCAFMDNFRVIFGQFSAYFKDITVVQSFFFPRGRFSTLLKKGERKGERSGYRQDPVISIVQAAHRDKNPYGKREKVTSTVNHTVGGQGPILRRADRPRRASRDPHPAGRDPHLLGHQPGHQGEWALVKETSRTQGLQPVHQGCMVNTKSNMVLTA